MPDNVVLNQGAGGSTVASDEINGIQHQRVKLEYGENGSATDVSTTNPLPITSKYFSNQVGVWGYIAGISGTFAFSGGKRIVSISAYSAAGGTMVINGGDSYPIVEATGIFISPQGNIVDPVVIFTGTNSFFIEYLS